MARGAVAETGVVTALSQEGDGIVTGGRTAFVGDALPGETVSFLRRRRYRQYDKAELLERLSTSPLRVTPQCAHFGMCGGCALQHLDSAAQLAVKEQQLRDALERIAQALLVREVLDAVELKLIMEGKPLPDKTPPPPPAAPPVVAKEPQITLRPEPRPLPGMAKGEKPATA